MGHFMLILKLYLLPTIVTASKIGIPKLTYPLCGGKIFSWNLRGICSDAQSTNL